MANQQANVRHRGAVRAFGWLLLLLPCACPPAPVADAGVDAGTNACDCQTTTGPRPVGTVDPRINELSGLVASHQQPGVYFAHNDSGDTARLFAMLSTGQVLQEFHLTNATNVDWEDLALGPCPTGQCVLVGDIGDNTQTRNDYALYRVTEPLVDGGTELTAEQFPFHYPANAHHNAETLLMHPTTPGRAWVVTKEANAVSQVYRLSLESTAEQEAQLVTSLTIPGPADRQLTAGDVNPCGDTVALRMYNRLVLLHVPDGGQFEDVFGAQPVTIPSAVEDQSEAVAFSADGRSIITTSETILTAPPIWEASCR